MTNLNNESGVSEASFSKSISEEVEMVSQAFADGERRLWGSVNDTWDVASTVIKKVQPVPWIFWIMIRSVYGRSAQSTRAIDPLSFSLVENLLVRGARDEGLVEPSVVGTAKTLTQSTDALGFELTATLCFIHAIAMRVGTSLNPRIFKVIMDDALIRARLGSLMGKANPRLGIGAPMLAGFAGRAGLAVQLASGTEVAAKRCLANLATGQDISEVGIEIYGCDPLQVASLSLVAGGCNKEIALGISAYSVPAEAIVPGSVQAHWLAMFTILEKVRLNDLQNLDPQLWRTLEFSEEGREQFLQEAPTVFRKGHKLDWLTLQLSAMLD